MSDTRTNPRGDSTDNRTVTLPVVPLTSTVVLPGAVATLALDSDDARRAAARARQGDGRVLLVPQVEGRYAKVGTVAHVENMGELPDGTVAILRTVQHAVIGAGVAGEGLWVSAEIVDDPARLRPSARSPRAPRRPRGGRRAASLPAAARDPAHGARARPAGRRRDVVGRQRDRGQARRARGDRCRRPAAARARLGASGAGGADDGRAHPQRRRRGDGQGATRVPPPSADVRDPQGARRRRRRRARRLPSAGGCAAFARERARASGT